MRFKNFVPLVITPPDTTPDKLINPMQKLTDKQVRFVHEYVIDWNATRAALKAGYSKKTARQMGTENLAKPYIREYIDVIKNDFEKLTGISKTRNLLELAKIAYSSIAHLNNSWIERKAFDKLTDDQKACIEIIDSKVATQENDDGEMVNIMHVKIKLFPKTPALTEINKMLGYHAAERSIVEIEKEIDFSGWTPEEINQFMQIEKAVAKRKNE